MSEVLITEDSTVLIPEEHPIPNVVQRYLNGESTESLAREAKTSRRTIYNWMHSELSDSQYKDLVKTAIVNRIADADEKLENAQTPLQVAQAREIAKFARWDAERRLPLFQPKQYMAVDKRVKVLVDRGSAVQAIDTTGSHTPHTGVGPQNEEKS